MFTDEEKAQNWPNRLYLLHENEEWLGEMAAKGLKLKSFSKESAFFEEVEPQRLRYVFVILREDGNPYDQIGVIERQGFALVGSFKEYYVFCIDARYVHTEPRLSEDTIEYTKKWFNRQMFNRLGNSIIALVPFAISMVAGSSGPVLWLAETSIFYFILFAATIVMVGASALEEYHIIIKSKKYFLNGEKYVIHTNVVKRFLQERALFLVVAVLAVGFVYNTYFSQATYQVPVAVMDETMPVVLLQDVMEDEEAAKILGELQKTVDGENYGYVRKSIFAPKQYEVNQHYTATDSYENLSATYFEVAIGELSDTLALEVLEGKTWDVDKKKIRAVEIEGLDTAYIYDEKDVINVSASKGKKVMYIWYTGTKTAEDILGEMAEVM